MPRSRPRNSSLAASPAEFDVILADRTPLAAIPDAVERHRAATRRRNAGRPGKLGCRESSTPQVTTPPSSASSRPARRSRGAASPSSAAGRPAKRCRGRGTDRSVAATVSCPVAGALPEATLVDETLPDVLVPRQPRDEAVEDRMHASALFAEGRLLFRREQFEPALARYERAYRYANGSTTILDEIVPLAYRLGRLDEAVRYAQHVSAQSAIDPFVLRRLALYLTEQEEYAQALRLYEIAIHGEEQEEVSVPTVITQFEIGRLMYLTDRFADAVQRFEQVRKVLQEADPPPADKAGRRRLAGRTSGHVLADGRDLSECRSPGAGR